METRTCVKLHKALEFRYVVQYVYEIYHLKKKKTIRRVCKYFFENQAIVLTKMVRSKTR